MRILVLQHIACEPPAVYEDVMNERGCEIFRVELDEGETMPGWGAFDGIVAMGGPMGTYDEAEHPWLHDEKTVIHDAVISGLPFFGACLGGAFELGHQVKARQGGVKLLPQVAAHLGFDQLGAGQHTQPQAQRLGVFGRSGSVQAGFFVHLNSFPICYWLKHRI